jgi:glutathione S-transferase
MRLFAVPASPFSRKVRVAAIELGLAERIEQVRQMPRDPTNNFHTLAPLAKIPVLEADDGTVFYDSPVICEYLNTLANGRLFRTPGPERWDALRREALADGLLDVALVLRGELTRPEDKQMEDVIVRQRATVDRVLHHLDTNPLPSHDDPDIGALAIGCAFGWLNFRLPDLAWQPKCPSLAAWVDKLYARPSFTQTMPS